jgi:hypothetical protein
MVALVVFLSRGLNFLPQGLKHLVEEWGLPTENLFLGAYFFWNYFRQDSPLERNTWVLVAAIFALLNFLLQLVDLGVYQKI